MKTHLLNLSFVICNQCLFCRSNFEKLIRKKLFAGFQFENFESKVSWKKDISEDNLCCQFVSWQPVRYCFKPAKAFAGLSKDTSAKTSNFIEFFPPKKFCQNSTEIGKIFPTKKSYELNLVASSIKTHW